MKCFRCGIKGHLIHSCPDRVGELRSAASAAELLPDRADSGSASLKETQQSKDVDSLLSQQEEQRDQAEVNEKIGQTATTVAESVLDDKEDVIDDDISKLWVKMKNPESKTNSVNASKV